VRDAEGNTALHFAAWCENAPVYRALLAAGADAEVVDNDGNTPSAVMSTAFRNKVADGA
jgi:ankyrin repeat protein